MTTRAFGFARTGLLSLGLAAVFVATAATAQVGPAPTVTIGAPKTAEVSVEATGIDASGNYQEEIKACRSGKTAQDRDTCLKEARHAQAERKRGALTNPGTDFQANAAARCQALTGEERAACQARMMGYGNTTGSVAGGGLLREVETVVVPPGTSSITVEPKTSGPVVLLPSTGGTPIPLTQPQESTGNQPADEPPAK